MKFERSYHKCSYLFLCEDPTNDRVFAGENASALNMNEALMMKQLGNGPARAAGLYFWTSRKW